MSTEESFDSSTAAGRGQEYLGRRFYGKYRGKVVANKDPKQKGRIQAIVPSVSPFMPTTWALPCVPYAGLGVGTFFVPPLNASVWIEFEEGNPRYPIWTGGFWDEKDLASIQPNPLVKPGDFTIRTISGNMIKLQDIPPEITIETLDKRQVSLGVDGISISWLGASIRILPMIPPGTGKIAIISPNNISINSALPMSLNGPL